MRWVRPLSFLFVISTLLLVLSLSASAVQAGGLSVAPASGLVGTVFQFTGTGFAPGETVALWINNPQYHRIHHSILPEHRDKNFCKLLPLIDVIFGTAWKPAADEFPPTGLVPSEKPATLLDDFLWPFRRPRPVAAQSPLSGRLA